MKHLVLEDQQDQSQNMSLSTKANHKKIKTQPNRIQDRRSFLQGKRKYNLRKTTEAILQI